MYYKYIQHVTLSNIAKQLNDMIKVSRQLTKLKCQVVKCW